MALPWPQVRAALVALHVVAILVLATPSAREVTNKRGWASRNFQLEMVNWSARLGTTPENLQRSLWAIATGYARTRRVLTRPFELYARAVGTGQGWSMFASPQKRPVEVHVDVLESGRWRPLVRPRAPDLHWRLRQLEHNRFRKMLGRFGRTFYDKRYAGLARWLARQALEDFSGVTEVRVRLYRYRSLPPERFREGARPKGRYEREIVYRREDFP